MLSDSESDVSDIRLTINEHYAKAYAYKKEREELGRLKEKYGSDIDEDDVGDDESDDESEDEDGEQLTPAVDAAILRTLAMIKRRDPEIYDNEKSIYEQERNRSGQSAHRSESKPATKGNVKPLTIKQHALSSMLNSGFHSPSPEPQIITHDEEQNALRSEAISAFHQALDIDVDGEDGDGFLVPRGKTKDEVEREEEEYKAFLEREVGEDISGLVTMEDEFSAIRETEDAEGEGRSADKETTPKGKNEKRKKGEEKRREETDQEFLMNYILNRGWIDRSSKRLPTYKEITGDVRESAAESQNAQGTGERYSAELSEDDEFEEIAERFESSYNFRFEEPGAAVIQTHPRNIDSAVRHPDTSRKKTRERRKQRKEEELLRKREEVKRLKALKMKELRQKIEKIGCEGGIDIDSQALTQFDLDGDWDPQKHDSQMAELYDETREEDVEKPQWDDDIDIGDVVGSVTASPRGPKTRKTKKTRKEGDEVANDGVDVDTMDADILVEQDQEEWDGTEEMRKRKLQEYMDEVYKIDFNDMVGGMPTRFKYTSVIPHNYALTAAETLLATDAELNEYMGIKKFAPYKKDNTWDAKRANRLKELKAKLQERRWVHGGAFDQGEENKKTKKRKGKKERQRAKAAGNSEAESKNVEEHERSSKKRKREKEHEGHTD